MYFLLAYEQNRDLIVWLMIEVFYHYFSSFTQTKTIMILEMCFIPDQGAWICRSRQEINWRWKAFVFSDSITSSNNKCSQSTDFTLEWLWTVGCMAVKSAIILLNISVFSPFHDCYSIVLSMTSRGLEHGFVSFWFVLKRFFNVYH